MRPFAASLIAALFISACASPTHTGGGDAGDLSNSNIVVKVLQEGLVGGDLDVINRYVAEDYIQHNPMAETGRAGLIGFIEYLKQQPKDQRISMKIVRVFEDGEFVVTHSDVMLGGKRHAVFDVFRVEGDMLREHWDAIEPNLSLPENSNVMFDGPVEPADFDKTGANKQLVRKFYEEVMVAGDYARMADYFENDTCIQHYPLIPTAVSELRSQLEKLSKKGTPFRYDKVVRVLGLGNFVLVQSRGGYPNEPAVLYDLLRVQDGKLAEHWMVAQAIPRESRNSNGMLPD